MLESGERKMDSDSHVRITVFPFPYIGNIILKLKEITSVMHNCKIGRPLVEKFKIKSQ